MKKWLFLLTGIILIGLMKLLVLDIKKQQYFSDRGYQDQHVGGLAFAHDEAIMGWLFGEHGKDAS